jgi:hypothetical protein
LPFVCLILFSALFNSLPAAQSQQPQSDAPPMQQRPRRVASSPPPQDDDEILRVETDLVLVDVSVTDAAGRPVRNLRRKISKSMMKASNVPSLSLMSRSSGERRARSPSSLPLTCRAACRQVRWSD